MFDTLGMLWFSMWNAFRSVWSFMSYEVIEGFSLGEMLFGAGIVTFLTYTVIKWLLDIT